jgi:hypothetical protein
MTDLSAPLTRHGSRKARDKGSRGPHLPITRIALGLVVVIALAIGARLLLVDDPTGGRPSATTQIAAGSGNAVAGSVSNGTATITADPDMIPLEDVPVPGSDASSFAVLDPAAIDPDLVEETEFGPSASTPRARSRPSKACPRTFPLPSRPTARPSTRPSPPRAPRVTRSSSKCRSSPSTTLTTTPARTPSSPVSRRATI